MPCAQSPGVREALQPRCTAHFVNRSCADGVHEHSARPTAHQKLDLHGRIAQLRQRRQGQHGVAEPVGRNAQDPWA
jgi:hypothetical protein